MLITVLPKDIEKAGENFHRVKGVARTGTREILVEYISHSGERRLLKIALESRVRVEHFCEALLKKDYQGCWHLGLAYRIMEAVHLPHSAFEIVKANPGPQALVEDLTPKILSRQGEFSLLKKETLDLPPKLAEKVLRFRERQEKRFTPEQKQRVPQAKRYIPVGKEIAQILSALLAEPWEPVLLIGPRGSGKSTLAETIANILHLPVRKVFGGIDINAEALLGGKTLTPVEGVDTVTEIKLRAAAKKAGIDPEPLVAKLKNAQLRVTFEPGLLLQAVLDGELLIIDEVNMLSPEVTSLLHGLLDWQKTLSVPGYGTVKAPPDFRVVACMNLNYAGTKPLNEAFADRFRAIKINMLPESQMASLLEEYTDGETARVLAKIFHALHNRVQNGDLSDRVLSLRALIRAAKEHQDGIGTLRETVVSNLTEGLEDAFEANQVRDLIEAHIA